MGLSVNFAPKPAPTLDSLPRYQIYTALCAVIKSEMILYHFLESDKRHKTNDY